MFSVSSRIEGIGEADIEYEETFSRCCVPRDVRCLIYRRRKLAGCMVFVSAIQNWPCDPPEATKAVVNFFDKLREIQDFEDFTPSEMCTKHQLIFGVRF